MPFRIVACTFSDNLSRNSFKFTLRRLLREGIRSLSTGFTPSSPPFYGAFSTSPPPPPSILYPTRYTCRSSPTFISACSQTNSFLTDTTDTIYWVITFIYTPLIIRNTLNDLATVGFIKSLLEELSDSMIIPAKERMTITRSTRFHLQISSYNIVWVRSTFGLLLYNTIVQFTFIESDYKVVNKATASDNHLLKWPLETRKLFARGRGTYLTIRITFSVFVSFSIKRQAFISH